MTTLSDIVQQAYREIDQIDEISGELTRNQFNEGLNRLNSIIDSSLGYEAGELLRDWPIGDYGSEYTVKERYLQNEETKPPINSRIIMGKEESFTVYLPPKPRDGSRIGVIDPHSLLSTYTITLDGNGRTVEGSATSSVTTAGTEKIWFYRADLADWVLFSTLGGADDMPFPDEYDDYFIVELSQRLAPRHSANIHPASIARARRVLSKLRSRYRQTHDEALEYGLLHRSNNRRVSNFGKGTY